MRVPPLLLALVSALLACGCGASDGVGSAARPRSALVVVSPHPDDESIFGAATIHRLASDPAREVRAIYVSAGDQSSTPGDCNGIPEAEKTERIVALREDETRAAWRILAPDREVPIAFERGPDQGLVASTKLVDGLRQDTLTAAGEAALAAAVADATDLPASVSEAWILTAARYDGHPDHRTAYRAARAAAETLASERGAAVHLWSFIVHDEFFLTFVPACCGGDFFWPADGATHDYERLVDTASRPRPPRWDAAEPGDDPPAIRRDALTQHVSQLVGNPALCMPVYIPGFYDRWLAKSEEPFYVEEL
ncbi:MAG: PIG-L family deacetylase [Deltaproteobacteria bacterium]|nr:PIG-L family deacetylase [Deltaproteobacteria bacterium]